MAWKLFARAPRRQYLDWASAAPVHPQARTAFTDALSAYGNPSSPHEEGRAARSRLDEARARVARLAGVKPRAVVFTSGATEANALAIQGRVRAAHAKGAAYEAMHILYSPTMHASALKAIEELQTRGVRTDPLPLREGAIVLQALEALVQPETILVCVDAVCGETGIRYDTRGMRRALDAKESGAALMVDASQLPLIEPIDRTRLGADLLTLDAQKVGGIRGVGALVVSKRARIEPLTLGGGQEAGLRPGTEPVALIAAFAEALTVCAERNGAFAQAARAERALLAQAITSLVPNAFVNEGARQAPHILNLSFPGIDTDYLVALLDRDGFAVSTKSACETGSTEGSKAVLALTGDPARAGSTLRISWGPETPQRALRGFPQALAAAVRFLRGS